MNAHVTPRRSYRDTEFYAALTDAINADPKILRSLVACSDSGHLTWLPRTASHFSPQARSGDCARWNANFAGRPCFSSIGIQGYRLGRIFGRAYTAHRIVYAVIHGVWPDQVDHIDGDRLNNHPRNLRSVSRAENNRNVGLSKSNSSGISGVSFDRRTGKWLAKCRVSGLQTFLGYFADKAEAAAAVTRARNDAGYHANHGRRRTYRDFCRPPLQLELTTKRPGDLVLTSSRVVQVVCFDRGGGRL